MIEQSNGILSAAAPQLFNLKLGDEEAWEIGLSCGGAVDVFSEQRLPDALEAEIQPARRRCALLLEVLHSGVGSWLRR